MLLHKSFFRFNCMNIFQFAVSVCVCVSVYKCKYICCRAWPMTAIGRRKKKNRRKRVRYDTRRRHAVNTQTKCICHLPGSQLGLGPIESNEKNAFAKKKKKGKAQKKERKRNIQLCGQGGEKASFAHLCKQERGK